MSSYRQWMYTRIRNGLLTQEFLDGLETFIQFATSQHSWMDGERIRCPCTQRKCQNTKFLDVPTVKYHLAKYGFVSDYYDWRFHGRSNVRVDVDRDVGGPSSMASEEASNAYHTMVKDGGVKKQRIYGLGTKASSFINDNSGSSSTTSHLNQDTMKEMVKEMVTQQLETMQAEMQAQIRAEMQAQIPVEMQAQIQAERTQMIQAMQA